MIDPTPEQIAERCAAIRAEWGEPEPPVKRPKPRPRRLRTDKAYNNILFSVPVIRERLR
jgi:hypothetical protein